VSSGPLGAAVSIAAPDEADEVASPSAAPDAADLSVRLQLSKLDDLVNLFGELLINRSILEERIDRLNRIVGDAVVVGERLRDVGTKMGAANDDIRVVSVMGRANFTGQRLTKCRSAFRTCWQDAIRLNRILPSSH